MSKICLKGKGLVKKYIYVSESMCTDTCLYMYKIPLKRHETDDNGVMVAASGEANIVSSRN